MNNTRLVEENYENCRNFNPNFVLLPNNILIWVSLIYSSSYTLQIIIMESKYNGQCFCQTLMQTVEYVWSLLNAICSKIRVCLLNSHSLMLIDGEIYWLSGLDSPRMFIHQLKKISSYLKNNILRKLPKIGLCVFYRSL